MKAQSPELPRIDHDSCISCGLCVEVCPDQIMRMDEAGRVAVVGERCMQCGHCSAVCPVEAVATVFLETEPKFISKRVLSAVQSQSVPRSLISLMRNRRSCRSFRTDPVDRELLEDLVKIGVTAPSGTNSQGWIFILLTDRADVVVLGSATAEFYRRLNRQASRPLLRFILRLIGNDGLENYYRTYYQSVANGLREWDQSGRDRLFHGAPAAIIVAGDSGSSCPAEDALLATQNILLAAESLGIGTCLIGFVVEAARRDRSIGALLGLSRGETIYSVIAVGHPAVEFARPAGRKPLAARIVRLAREMENEPQTIQRDRR